MLVNCIWKTVQSVHLCFTSLKPSGRTIHRIFHIIPVCNTGRTLVKCHRNGGGQIGLDLHTLLRSHKNLSSIDMRVKVYSLFFYSSEPCQRKHLKSTGISKNRLVPHHKLMKTAKFLYDLISRSYMKMICVG